MALWAARVCCAGARATRFPPASSRGFFHNVSGRSARAVEGHSEKGLAQRKNKLASVKQLTHCAFTSR